MNPDIPEQLKAEKLPYAEEKKYKEMHQLFERNEFRRVFSPIQKFVQLYPHLFLNEKFWRYYDYFDDTLPPKLTGEDFADFKMYVMEPFFEAYYTMEPPRPELDLSEE